MSAWCAKRCTSAACSTATRRIWWPLGFVVPAYNLLDQPFYGIGLKMYDMLAGKLNLSPSRWLSRRDTLANAPTLAEQVNGRGLKGGVLYYDGQFDDARLAMSLMRTLFDLGGTAVNYVRATGLTMTNGKVDGVTATDALGDAVFTLRARCVINATGVWTPCVAWKTRTLPPWSRPARACT